MLAHGHSRRALLDGALPLIALLSVALMVSPGAVYAVAALYLLFAAAMASGGAQRPGEPPLAWRLYATGMGALAVVVPLTGAAPQTRPLLAAPLSVLAAGLIVHVHGKARFGLRRAGIVSAWGRRVHDARVGRTLEATALVLVAAVVSAQPALFAVAGWLVTAAAVAERPEPAVAGGFAQRPATSTVT